MATTIVTPTYRSVVFRSYILLCILTRSTRKGCRCGMSVHVGRDPLSPFHPLGFGGILVAIIAVVGWIQ